MEKENKFTRIFSKISKLAGIFTMLVGVLVLVGWVFDITFLKSISSNFIAMKANTALAFVLAGLALLFAQKDTIRPWKQNVGRLASTLVALIGLATLSEYIFGWNLGIDQLLFRESASAILTPYLGRMAPATAFNFSLLGIALLYIGHNRHFKWAQYLCFFALIPSLMGIIGYLYSVHEFREIISAFTPMALHTVFAFFILSLGVLFSRPDSYFIGLLSSEGMGGVIVRSLIPITTILFISLGYFQVVWQANDSEEYVNNTTGSSDFSLHMAIFVVSAIIVFTIIIWLVAIIVHKLDEERVSVTESYKIERDKIQTLLQSIGDAIIVIDRSWNIILFNKVAEKLSGWTDKEVAGKPLCDFIKLIKTRDRSENIQFIENAMVMKQVSTLKNHTILIKKDGEEVSVGDSASPILNEKGEVMGAVIIMRDISKEREASMLKTDFGYASHQLRTPLNKAMWLLGSILNSGDHEKTIANAKIAYQALESVQKLTEKLIDVSEVDRDTIVVKKEAVKLSDLLDNILKSVEKKVKERNIKIMTSPVSATASINTDQRLLEKSLMEVLNNAIAYGPDKAKIDINCSNRGKDVLFEIQDYGIGIAEEHQPLIFTKFFRGSNYDTTEIVGAGLGLFLVREYIRRLGGKIWFKSEEGKGSVFYVSLPLDG